MKMRKETTFQEFQIARNYLTTADITFPTSQVVKHLNTLGRYWKQSNITVVYESSNKPFFPRACSKDSNVVSYDSKTDQYRVIEFNKHKGNRYRKPYTYKSFGFNVSRFDGPAVVTKTNCQWIVNGQRHRTDGPAIVHKNGEVQWFIHNKDVTEDVNAWIIENNMRKWEDWTAGDKVFFKMKFYQK